MKTRDELGKRLREAKAALGDITDCGSIHSYVEAAGDAWKGGVINTQDYCDALAHAWSMTRAHYLSGRPKPTIAELETLLASDATIRILPDGSLDAKPTEEPR